MRSPKSIPAPSPYAEPSGAPAAALPGVLRQRLGGLRRRHLAVTWTEGAALMVGALVVLIAVQLLGDWFLDLPLPVRAILLVADVVALGWLVWRGLVRPWRQRLTSATAALRAEKTFPSLRGSLISAVQLSQGTDTGTVSPGLLSAVVTRAAASVQPLKFAQIIPAARAARLALGCLALLAAALAVIALDSARSGPLLRRFVLSNEPLPTRTRVIAVTQDLRAATGADVELIARAEGEIPRTGRVRIHYEDGKHEDIAVAADSADPGMFKLIVPALRVGLSYRFHLGDGRGAAFNVRALTPPALASLAAEEIFPAYTGRGALARPPASLTLLAGSRLRLQLRSTLPLTSATLHPRGAGEPVAMTLDSDGRGASGELSIPADNLAGFSIALVSTEGAPSLADTVYRINITRDQAPVIDLRQPSSERETITLRASPVIEFEAADDFALTGLALCYQITPPPEGFGVETIPIKVRTPFPIEGAPGRQRRAYPWKLSAVEPRIVEGSVITYWIEATDNNTATGPGVTTTRRQQFVIVSPLAKREEILRRIGENSTRLKDLSDTQRKLGEEIDALIVPAAP